MIITGRFAEVFRTEQRVGSSNVQYTNSVAWILTTVNGCRRSKRVANDERRRCKKYHFNDQNFGFRITVVKIVAIKLVFFTFLRFIVCQSLAFLATVTYTKIATVAKILVNNFVF